MQRTDRWPEEFDPETSRSRPGSRRNSTSQSRRNSVKKEKEGKKKSPLDAASNSNNSTPKKATKPQNLDFIVTGKQCVKRSDRANSLPGYHRRPSAESIRTKRSFESPKRVVDSQSSKSRETSLEDDVSLDLSQVSDFEDTNSKYGIPQKVTAFATSTPKTKPRSGSLQNQLHSQRVESRRAQKTDSKSRDSVCSRESLYKTSSSASPYRYGVSTELDYSSVSPEYSGQSSTEMSPRVSRLTDTAVTPRSQDMMVSSCCGGSWQECSEIENTAVEGRADGEWNNFWANYNNSIAKVPMKSYYDQCPTPYRTENIDLADLEFSADGSRKRSPDNIEDINYIIRNEGLHLTPRETQNIIKCAHILGNVLSKAIERRCREKDSDTKIQEVKSDIDDPARELKKKTMKLDLKETHVPVNVVEEKRSETVTTQTDISLPNTKSAPRIFEKILRQLSRTSLEEATDKKAGENKTGDEKVVHNKEEEKKEVQKEN
ncbi:uncharacterized protein LOC113517672 isoform X2 [Galleria mellonella]|uniref:Uncharacterized protein LOC113517672 isoform X2 n=1 Tax=Galleria mellonella TaxID=7137 RepID=A0ABM3MB61_GALME|nr:uncharacterized protein LOC113517672 isoform X2 [Galleria mellonella]